MMPKIAMIINNMRIAEAEEMGLDKVKLIIIQLEGGKQKHGRNRF